MKSIKFFVAPFIITLLFCVKCNYKKKEIPKVNTLGETIIKPKYATGFYIIKSKNNTIQINICSPITKDTISYYLVSKNHSSKESINKDNLVKTPIQRIIATSTTDIPFIEILEKEKTLVGFPQTKYISSKAVRKLINKKKLKDIGTASQLNTEDVLSLQPELLIDFSITSDKKAVSLLKRNKINTILNNSWQEQHPLGRVEWLKVFGYLYEKEKKADSIFRKIENNYNHLKTLAQSASNSPTVLSGNLFKDIWYTPAGESFEAQLLKDAKADYIWKNTNGTGSLSLNIETIISKALNADIWIGGGKFKTIEELILYEEKYGLLKPTKSKNVYTKDLTQGETGGIIYFEMGSLRPDWILEDLIQIFHPNLVPQKPFHFYKKLN